MKKTKNKKNTLVQGTKSVCKVIGYVQLNKVKDIHVRRKTKKWNSSENGMKGRVIRGRIMCKLNTDKREAW